MSESQFNQFVDDLLARLENALQSSDTDFHCEPSAGMFTITCEADHSKIIVSRQSATHELWVAAKSGGYHCSLEGGTFHCKLTSEDFPQLMSRVLAEQSGEIIRLSL